jgi:uncharacterized protein YdhG (YjbR/CyaY superfamily)
LISPNGFDHIGEREMVSSDTATVDEYISELEGDRKEAVIRLRTILKGSVPGLEETMSHGMPYYTKGDDFYAIAAQKHYISLYVSDMELLKRYSRRLGKVNLGKSCVRFRRLENIDLNVVGRMLTEMDSKD